MPLEIVCQKQSIDRKHELGKFASDAYWDLGSEKVQFYQLLMNFIGQIGEMLMHALKIVCKKQSSDRKHKLGLLSAVDEDYWPDW